jgi:hypothetical protein
VTKFILGSGITGLLARAILGDSWQLIPFGRSRFYSHIPPLADDLITWSADIDEAIEQLGYSTVPVRCQRGYSYGGQLIFSDHSFAKTNYLTKLFGSDPHPGAEMLLRSDSMVYKDVITTRLYESLQNRFKLEINRGLQRYGNSIEAIDTKERIIITSAGKLGYSQIVSTIPLGALQDYCGNLGIYPGRDVWYYDVTTPSLNFEGAHQVFVADLPFDFFKVTNNGMNNYMFECLQDLGNPTQYLAAFLNDQLEIKNATSMQKAIPIGPPPPIGAIEDNQIYPVGCHAQWDYFMNVSSSIKRLLRLRNERLK